MKNVTITLDDETAEWIQAGSCSQGQEPVALRQ